MSKKKKYSTFEEIDIDLRRLYLQSEINKEELKLMALETKDSLTPVKLFGGILSGVASSALILKLLTPVASFAIGKLISNFDKPSRPVVQKPWWTMLFK